MSRRLKIFVAVLLVLLAGVASLPWWLGGVLRPILRSKNITFERYEREGYAHFRLRNATFHRDRVTVTIATLHAPTPSLWLGQWLRSGPLLTAEDWSLHIEPALATATAAPETSKSVYGYPSLHALLHDRVWPRLVRWLPHAELKNGTLRGPGLDLTIADTNWDRGTLRVDDVHRANFVFSATATPSAAGAYSIDAHAPGNDARLQFVWSGAEAKGTGLATFHGQPVQWSAAFAARGWLPAEGSAVAEHWSLPAADVKLGAPYARAHGDARLEWRDGSFTLAVSAAADPAAGAKAPPFSARAEAHGNLRELTLTALDVNAPFATAKLTAPVTLSLDRPLAAESAELFVQADLEKIPWIRARGTVQGSLHMNGGDATSRQTFTLESHDVALPGFTLQQARLTGSLQWPRLELTTVQAQLDADSRVDAHGAIDWKSREITGDLQAKLGPLALARWLPAGVTWTTAGPHRRRGRTARRSAAPRHAQGRRPAMAAFETAAARCHLAGRGTARGCPVRAAHRGAFRDRAGRFPRRASRAARPIPV